MHGTFKANGLSPLIFIPTGVVDQSVQDANDEDEYDDEEDDDEEDWHIKPSELIFQSN